LKSLVTEPTVLINEKFQPARQINSYHRFFAATNSSLFKNTEPGDRRDFTLRVSDSRKGDFAYWTELNHEIKNGGVEALAYDLLEMDLSHFNIRNKPNTAELLEQKLHSLTNIHRWWFDCLDNGGMFEGAWPNFAITAKIIEDVVTFTGGKMRRRLDARDVGKAMQELCPSAKQHQQQSQYSRHRGYLLPSLQQARPEFDQYIGGAVEWPEAG
jgi:hypothetical protein